MSAAAFPRLPFLSGLRAMRLSLGLLLERRAGLYVTLDLLVLLVALVATFASSRASGLYAASVIPFLVPGILVLSDTVALERRAGSLDLALSSPGARYYFEKRIGGFSAILAVQSCLILILQRLTAASFPLLPALLQIGATALLVGSITLCWSVVLKTGEAAALASGASAVLLARWLFASPIPDLPPGGIWLGFEGTMDWLRVNAALLLAAAVFYAYARRRIAVPERILE